ncbi:DNA internalization-related competence protein ComEC/Rec2 [Alteromonas sp. A079]|uniref:DNA internalization-related competence protein ComEC/Rec2 n=1 Tax=Alteromonas sp. A079 TaxID=3410268 RepID=UPI003B9DC900
MHNNIITWCACFCVGAISSQFWPSLPSYWLLFTLIVTVTAPLRCTASATTVMESIGRVMFKTMPLLPNCYGLCRDKVPKRTCLVLSGSCAGIIWMASLGYFYQSWQLTPMNIQQDVIIKGQVIRGGCITDIQTTDTLETGHAYRYDISASHLQNKPLEKRVLISVYAYEPSLCFHNGDTVAAVVKLKPAYGRLNPYDVNAQKLYLSKGVVAVGYIKKHTSKVVKHAHSVRYKIASYIQQMGLTNQAWFLALLLGERSEFTADDWSLLQRTGTAHVFSISGMHLAIVAAAVMGVSGVVILMIQSFLAAHRPISNARYVVLYVVLSSAFFYVLLSGGALPVFRAFILLFIACMLTYFARVWRVAHIGVVMTTACIVIMPFSVYQSSFYLSLSAVMAIWFLTWRFQLGNKPWYLSLLYIQLGLSLMLSAITLCWFGQVSLVGVFVNLIILPIVTLALPLVFITCLLGYVLSDTLVGSWLSTMLQYSDEGFSLVLSLLHWVSGFSNAVISAHFSIVQTACFVVIFVISVLPYWRGKYSCVGMLTGALCISFIAIPYPRERWYLHVFDVGQGTAMVITKGHRAIVVDTGPSYNGNAPIVTHVIPNVLRQYGVRTVDHVVLSHSDNDHAGGREALTQWLARMHYTPEWYSPSNGCEQGKRIRWEGLTMAFLWPPKGNHIDSNNTSCVLQISDGNNVLLLPGDIERSAEYALLQNEKTMLADVLVAPHHGSGTSSTNVWVKRVQPYTVIYTQGFENRWKFPNEKVYKRYKLHGAKQYLSSEQGYIRVEFSQNGHITTGMRSDILQRWYLPPRAPRHI